MPPALNTIREKVCPECGEPFEYRTGIGRDRVVCGKAKCTNRRNVRLRKAKLPHLPKCKNPECDRPADRCSHGVCNTFFFRIRRTGTFERRQRTRRPTIRGYLLTRATGHALATTKDSMVYEHRLVAYDKHSGVCPPCYWCGASLSWDRAVVDHLNANKQDNEPSNLEVCCTPCNVRRAAMMGFIATLSSERIDEVVRAIEDGCNSRKCNRTNDVGGRGRKIG